MKSVAWKSCVSAVCCVIAVTSMYAERPNEVFRLSQGRLYVNHERLPGIFSTIQDRFAFLYVYVPHQGLFVVSNREFPNADKVGSFAVKTLQFETGGISFVLKSATCFFNECKTAEAWVHYDPAFSLPRDAVMFGYGDSADTPYEWPEYIHDTR